MKTKNPALLLIDIQKGFDKTEYWGGGRNNPNAEATAGKLLKFWREQNYPVFHIQHCSTTPGSPLAEGEIGNAIKEEVAPIAKEPVIKKNVNSGFIGTNLLEQLKKLGIKEVVIAGLTTDHCISTTARMAGNLGFDTYIVSDGTATFDKIGANGKKFSAELIHETALASLHGEFGTVMTSYDLIAMFQRKAPELNT